MINRSNDQAAQTETARIQQARVHAGRIRKFAMTGLVSAGVLVLVPGSSAEASATPTGRCEVLIGVGRRTVVVLPCAAIVDRRLSCRIKSCVVPEHPAGAPLGRR